MAIANGQAKMTNSKFVANGRRNALNGIDADVRAEIEATYADEWNNSSYIRRWFLLRKINREVATRIAERANEAPADALY